MCVDRSHELEMQYTSTMVRTISPFCNYYTLFPIPEYPFRAFHQPSTIRAPNKRLGTSSEFNVVRAYSLTLAASLLPVRGTVPAPNTLYAISGCATATCLGLCSTSASRERSHERSTVCEARKSDFLLLLCGEEESRFRTLFSVPVNVGV